MSDEKTALLPFAPYSTGAIEDWINEEARQGWQVAGAVPFMPFLIKFSRGKGGPYHIELEGTSAEEGVVLIPGCGSVVSGELDEYERNFFAYNASLIRQSLFGLLIFIIEMIVFSLLAFGRSSGAVFDLASWQAITFQIYFASALYIGIFSVLTFFHAVVPSWNIRRGIWPTIIYRAALYVSFAACIILLPHILAAI